MIISCIRVNPSQYMFIHSFILLSSYSLTSPSSPPSGPMKWVGGKISSTRGVWGEAPTENHIWKYLLSFQFLWGFIAIGDPRDWRFVRVQRWLSCNWHLWTANLPHIFAPHSINRAAALCWADSRKHFTLGVDILLYLYDKWQAWTTTASSVQRYGNELQYMYTTQPSYNIHRLAILLQM